MKVKYQIFVSSTYEDLKSERDTVIKAILELGHIPVGMEMFSAGDEEQWELIKRQIDDSDYYVVILAHRYGSRDGAISYTEKEYDYATLTKVPTLGFVIDGSANWSPKLMDSDPKDKAALDKFKQKVKTKIINIWKTPEELHGKVSIALAKALTAYPRPGWVRATTTIAPEVANELSRLSKENAELRARTYDAAKEAEIKKEAEEETNRVINILASNFEVISLGLADKEGWTKGTKRSLYEIFELFADQMLIEISLTSLAALLAVHCRNEGIKDKNLRHPWPVPRNLLTKMLAYFKALGLVAPSSRKHAVSDKDEYWSITAKGERIHSEAIVKRLEEKPTSVIPSSGTLTGPDESALGGSADL